MFYVNFIFRDLKHFDQNCPSLHSVKRPRFSFFPAMIAYLATIMKENAIKILELLNK